MMDVSLTARLKAGHTSKVTICSARFRGNKIEDLNG